MSVDGTSAVVENLIADHIATSFQREGRKNRPAVTIAQIRERITDSFLHGGLNTEQDNSPPEILEPCNSLLTVLAPAHDDHEAQERAAKLAGLKDALEGWHNRASDSVEARELESAKEHLIFQRQQLLLKNEVTEGLGRIEVWILSLASLVPIFLKDVSSLWALPILAASIGRSWLLDSKCKRRLGRIVELDRLIEAKLSTA